MASNYTMLLFSRLGFAVGEAVVAPAATSWIGDLFPATQRARALALFMLGVPVGGALSYFFSGPVAQAYGWRTAMVLAAAPAVLLIPVLLRLRTSPARRRRSPSRIARQIVDDRDSQDPHHVVDHRFRRAAQFQYVRDRHLPARVSEPHPSD